MIIGSFYCFFLYLFSVLIFFYSFNPLIFWIFMEINLLLFILLMFFLSESKPMYQGSSFFFYFIMQSFLSFIFLSSIYFHSYYKIFSDILFNLSICGKLGIFPIYFWVLHLSKSMPFNIFVILLTLQKIPMFLIFFNSDLMIMLLILFSSLIFGMIMIFFSVSILEVLIFSSISSSFMIFFLFIQSVMVFFLFFFFYFYFLHSLRSLENGLGKDLLLKIFIFMFFCGLPPLSLFFFKFYTTFMILFFGNNFVFLIFWVCSFFSLVGYVKFFYITFFNFFSLYLNHKFFFKKVLFFSFVFLNFLFFF